MPHITNNDLYVVIQAELERADGKALRHGKNVHTYMGGTVENVMAIKYAMPMYFVWRSYFKAHRWTEASVRKVLAKYRGNVIWRMAITAKARGYRFTGIPSKMFRAPKHIERAFPSSEDQSPEDFWDQADVQDFLDNSEALFDETLSRLTADDLTDIYATLDPDLEYYDWLANSFLTDLQVLQLIDAFFAEQVATASGRSFLQSIPDNQMSGIWGDFNIVDYNTTEFLRRQSSVYVTHINETTRQQLADALWEGFTAPDGKMLSVDAISQYIRTQMAAYNGELSRMDGNRARMIATTEIARAETFGNYVSMIQSGVKWVVWQPTTGACQICLTNASVDPIPEEDASKEIQHPLVIAIMQPFPSGVFAPPAHPYCRCSVAMYIDPHQKLSDFSWSPDNAQLDKLLSDPSFALWPRQMIDLQQPELKLIDPTKVDIIQWEDLPKAIQDILTPEGLREIQDQLGMGTVDDFAAKMAALAAAHKPAIDLDQTIIPPQVVTGQVLTLDDILNGMGQEEQINIIDGTTDTLGQILSDLGDALDLGDDGTRSRGGSHSHSSHSSHRSHSSRVSKSRHSRVSRKKSKRVRKARVKKTRIPKGLMPKIPKIPALHIKGAGGQIVTNLSG